MCIFLPKADPYLLAKTQITSEIQRMADFRLLKMQLYFLNKLTGLVQHFYGGFMSDQNMTNHDTMQQEYFKL